MDKITIIILAIIITLSIVGLAFGVYIYFLTPTATMPKSDGQNQQTQQADAPADWKIYTNEKYRFEVKYPGDWLYRVDSQFGSQNTFTFLSPEENQKITEEIKKVGNVAWENANTIQIQVRDNQDELTAKELHNNFAGGEETLSSSLEIMVGGKKGLIGNVSGMRVDKTVYVPNGNKIYIFSTPVSSSTGITKYSDVFNQILSTFKFTGDVSQNTQNADVPADWKIYTNEKYGYEFKFPQNWFVKSRFTPLNSGTPISVIGDITGKDDFVILSSQNFINGQDDASTYPMGTEYFTIEYDNPAYSPFAQGLETVDDYWNKLGKKDEQTGEIVNKFIEKKSISGVDFIFFDQYNWNIKAQKKIWEPQVIFSHNGIFFWIKGGGESGQDMTKNQILDQILSTFKFTK